MLHKSSSQGSPTLVFTGPFLHLSCRFKFKFRFIDRGRDERHLRSHDEMRDSPQYKMDHAI